MDTIVKQPIRDSAATVKIKQENARLRILLRAVKRIVPIAWQERIDEELGAE